ncbi:MAG TPA: hypothetical protein PKW90_27365, partial [Myxococcota bacterium]|nr:hypothetical protein [Myxococcota bacterium]
MTAGTLWKIDGDRDGVDELAWVHGGAVEVVNPWGAERPRWSWRGMPSPLARILEVRSYRDGRAPEITAVRESGDQSVVGLEVASETPRWSCAAPLPREYQGSYVPVVASRLDVAGGVARRPFVSFVGRDIAYGRSAHVLPSAVSGPARAAAVISETTSRRVERDPRWGRSLPWVAYASGSWEVPHFLRRAGVFGLTLIILPMLGAGWLVRRRPSQPVRAAMAGAIGLLLVLVSFVPMGVSPAAALERWKLAGFAAPLLTLMGVMGWWLWRRRWRSLLGW